MIRVFQPRNEAEVVCARLKPRLLKFCCLLSRPLCRRHCPPLKSILHQPTFNLSSGPPPRPVSLPPKIGPAAANPFASLSKIQWSPVQDPSTSGQRQSLGTRLMPQEPAQLPKESQSISVHYRHLLQMFATFNSVISGQRSLRNFHGPIQPSTTETTSKRNAKYSKGTEMSCCDSEVLHRVLQSTV